jgi:hypothetical protein
MALSLSVNVNCWNGIARGFTASPAAAPSAAASFSWSNAGLFVLVEESPTTKTSPPSTVLRYQNRVVPSIHVAGPATSAVSPCSFSRKSRARW